MATFERRAQLNKVDAFSVDVSQWLDGEVISTASVVADALLNVTTTTTDTTSVNFLANGVSVGVSKVEITVNTPTRSRCFEVSVKVVEGG